MTGTIPTLIVLCGWGLSGKTTIAEGVAQRTGIHLINIDAMRRLAFGNYNLNPGVSPQLMERDVAEMYACYRLLLRTASERLALGDSVIITATFSRRMYHDWLDTMISEHRDACIRIIECDPSSADLAEIERRIAERNSDPANLSSIGTLARYYEVSSRFVSMRRDHLTLDTSHPEGIGTCVNDAVEYIVAYRP